MSRLVIMLLVLVLLPLVTAQHDQGERAMPLESRQTEKNCNTMLRVCSDDGQQCPVTCSFVDACGGYRCLE
nr:conotoxin DGF M9.6 [Conus magus]